MVKKQIRHLLKSWTLKQSRYRRARISWLEQLEARRMMVAAIWTNVLQPLDVTGDEQTFVTPRDVLLVINELNNPVYSLSPNRELPDEYHGTDRPPYLDVSCDGFVTPRDALLIINRINSPSDAAGNALEAALPTWRFDSEGGSSSGAGRVTANACSPRLIEGDSYASQLSTTLVLPDDSSAMAIHFDAPSFDLSSQQTIRDAFEIMVVDQAGQPLVLPHAPGRDTVFNWSEGLAEAVGAGTQYVSSNVGGNGGIASGTVTVNLAGIPVGTLVNIVVRLVNNDRDDTTSITLRGIEVIDSQVSRPASFSAASTVQSARVTPDLALLTDVSSSLKSVYGRTTLSDQDPSLLTTELQFFNQGSYPIVGSLVAVLSQLSDPSINLLNPDGYISDGRPYVDLTSHMSQSGPGLGTLGPDATTTARSLRFKNPTNERFSYAWQVLSGLNTPLTLTGWSTQLLVWENHSQRVCAPRTPTVMP